MKALLTLTAIFLISCSSNPKQEEVVLAPVKTMIPSGYVPPDAKLLTKEGENIEGYFSPDGNRVLFRSEKRIQHQHPQIYEMDLSTYKERRVTFHDGEDTCPFYHPKDGRIFYSSTTDEIKEESQLDIKTSMIAPLLSVEPTVMTSELPPFEIYESGLDGTNIARITNSEGYDSEVSVHPSGQNLIFSSNRSGDIELHTLDLRTKGVKKITAEPGADGGAFYSPKGRQIVWRHFNPEMTVAQIWLASQWGTERKVITTKKAIHWAPFWHPNGREIILSSNRDEVQNFELYTVDVKGLCLKRLTYSAGSDSNPVFSPDGTKIVFTSNRTGKNQLYVMDYKPPEACADELP